MGDAVAEKIEYFKAVTGVDDTDLCTDILTAHNWDLEQAINSFTTNTDNHPPIATSSSSPSSSANPPMTQPLLQQQELGLVAPPGIAWRLVTLPFSIIAGTIGLVSGAVGLGITWRIATFPFSIIAGIIGLVSGAVGLGIAWRLVTLPFSVIAGTMGMVSSAVGLGLWAVGGILSYSLSTVGLTSPRNSASTSSSPSEAATFVNDFQQIYGSIHPNFIPEGFNEALQRSRHEFKLLFVYLHSPDHPDTPAFCEGVLCSEVLAAFINENFVAWGGSIRAPEGFKMSNSLKASRFPFCAVVMAATNNRIALLQQVEGLKSTEEMVTILQRVLEESAPVLVSARLDAEERRTNIRLREEQDAAYRAALEADQARERQRKEEEERVEREAAEAERKRKEEEEARERAAYEAIEKEAALARMREEKAQSLGAEPDKGADVTQVLVRFPTGERQGRRFHCTSTIQTLYDYVDSLGCLEVESYSLVSNFPRVVYGKEKLNMSLKEAGLHPQASLFVEISS